MYKNIIIKRDVVLFETRSVFCHQMEIKVLFLKLKPKPMEIGNYCYTVIIPFLRVSIE